MGSWAAGRRRYGRPPLPLPLGFAPASLRFSSPPPPLLFASAPLRFRFCPIRFCSAFLRFPPLLRPGTFGVGQRRGLRRPGLGLGLGWAGPGPGPGSGNDPGPRPAGQPRGSCIYFSPPSHPLPAPLTPSFPPPPHPSRRIAVREGGAPARGPPRVRGAGPPRFGSVEARPVLCAPRLRRPDGPCRPETRLGPRDPPSSCPAAGSRGPAFSHSPPFLCRESGETTWRRGVERDGRETEPDRKSGPAPVGARQRRRRSPAPRSSAHRRIPFTASSPAAAAFDSDSTPKRPPSAY